MLCFPCPKCREMMSAPDDAVGETVACPLCYQYLQVPKVAPTRAPQAPAQPQLARQQSARAPAPPPPPRPVQQQVMAAPPRPATPPAPPPKPSPPRRPLKVVLNERLAGLKARMPAVNLAKVPKWAWAAGAGGLVVLLLFSMIVASGGRGVKPSKDLVKKANVDDDVLYDLKATTLFREYQENRLKADQDYKGKELFLAGEVHSVDQADSGNIIVYLIGGRYELTRIHCSLDAKFRDDVVRLKAGSKVRIRGKCEGKSSHSGHVMMTNCELLN